MSEYICREEVYQKLHDAGSCGATEEWSKGYDDGIDTAINIIENMPIADVVPAVHGHWVDNCADKYYVRCFVCANIGYRSFKYCPHCGAKMDKEAEEK